jgi:hypothetical protein
MKPPGLIKNLRERRARKKFEREKARRAGQDENAMDRVAEVGKTVGGGGGPGI